MDAEVGISEDICVTRIIAENFKCLLCKKHAFVSPITTKDGKSLKCGRCSFIKSEHHQRMYGLEKLLSFMKLPCTFHKCDAKIPWGKVADHEKLCNYRVIKCPFQSCGLYYHINQIVVHFTRNHRFSITTEMWLKQNLCEARAQLILYKEQPYLMFSYKNRDDIWISVYAAEAEQNVSFQVIFYCSNTKQSILYEGKNPPIFNEQEHCIDCLNKNCKSVLHKNSLAYSNHVAIYDNMAFHIKRELIDKAFGSKQFYCRVEIIESDVTKKYEEIEEHNSRKLLKILECPACQVPMSAPVYSCEIGHAICKSCKKTIIKCPTCESQITESRCFGLEGIAQTIQLLCSNKKYGCSFVGNVDECMAHENICIARLPLSDS